MRKIGKKFEMYYVENYNEKVEIRFVSDKSLFFAEFCSKTIEDKDLNSLKKKLDELGEAKKRTTWKPVILIDFQRWCNDQKPYDIDKRLLGTTIFPDGRIEKFLAHITTDWKQEHDDTNSDNWIDCFPHDELSEDKERYKIISYTPEKYKALKFIILKLDNLKEQISEIINSDDCELFIENINENNFLKLENKQR